ncbi:MAG TPA: hypothetical protein VK675_00990, partial [Candidatus Paceibacterota bacterium]|nr:hypothetical protein [Candidatus Paceibacterota bacterium]
MKWTDVKAGLVNGAFQRLMVGLGEDADTVINLINNEPTFVGRLVWFAKKGGKPYTLYKKAREIMGGNFFGVEEAIKHFGISVSNHQFATLAEIP